MRKNLIELTLGGEKRPLTWDNEAILDWEEAASFTAGDGTVVKASGFDGMRMETTRDLIAAVYACLCAGARERGLPLPTFRAVRTWLMAEDPEGLKKLSGEALDIIRANEPDPEEVDGDDVGEGDDGAPDPTTPTEGDGSGTPTPTESSSSDSESESSGG